MKGKNKVLSSILKVCLVFFILVGTFFSYKILTNRLVYSNLVDDETLNLVSNDLLEAGVNQKNVDLFKRQVKSTNAFLGDFEPFKEGFTTIKSFQVKYDEYEAFNKFSAIKVPYFDINCRIGAFNLIEDIVTSNPYTKPVEEDFEYELSTINDHPDVDMDDESKSKFYSLFAPIQSSGFKTARQTVKLVRDEWEKRGVKFEDSNRTLISAFSYRSDKKTIEAQHVGVLIKRDNDYIFVEKYNPTLPFQVSIFKNKSEVKSYVKSRMLSRFMFGTTLMENDQLF